MRYLPRLLARPSAARLAGLVALAGAWAATARAGAFRNSAHGDRALLPRRCGSCHVGHGPPQTRMLPDNPEATCLRCHGDAAGRSAARGKRLLAKTHGLANITAEFHKPSRHPLREVTRRPRRGEPPGAVADFKGTVTAVACSDCHEPHYMVKADRRRRAGARSVRVVRTARGKARPEHDLCYRCHGSSSLTARGKEDIQRLLRPGNPSYHPVEARGRNPKVPSLIKPHTEESILACTDCHGSDNASGPRGPHGSVFAPILNAHYGRDDGRPESSHQYALCYRCHNRSVLLSSASFPEHRRHVVDVKTSCYTCHDSHGSTQFTHLIEFDTKVVSSNGKGQRRFDDLGDRQGTCSLRCHDKDHDQQRY